MGSKYDQIRTSPQTGLQFRRLPVQPGHGTGPSHSRLVGNPSEKVEVHKGSQQLYGQTIHVPDRPTYSNGKTGQFRSPSYEAHSMALEETLARPRSIRESYPGPTVAPPHLDWWLDETKVLTGQPWHPLQHAVQLFTDASNEGWGAHLGDSTARGVWSPMESRLHINLLELKAVLLALKQFEHLKLFLLRQTTRQWSPT